MADFKLFAEATNKATYPCSCHCGKSTFTTKMSPLDTIKIASCNCSICAINGYLNVYPLRKDVEWQSGFDELGSYRFAGQTRAHKFCKTCGTSLIIDFDKVDESFRQHVALNVRHPDTVHLCMG